MKFISLELPLEQQFQLRLLAESAENMSREQAIKLLVEMSRLLMIKDHIIRQLVREVITQETFNVQPDILLNSG